MENSRTRGGKWMRIDGAWRETRSPTMEEVKKKKKIDGETQTLGFGESADSTYVELLTKNPNYAEYLAGEGKKDHIDVKKFAEWITQRGVAIIVDVEKLPAAERSGVRSNVYRRGGIRILDNSRVK